MCNDDTRGCLTRRRADAEARGFGRGTHRCCLFAVALLASLGSAHGARADEAVVELGGALEGGAAFGLARSRYQPTDDPTAPARHQERDGVGLAGGLELTATFALAGPVRLGGLVRLGLADVPADAFGEASALQLAIGVGPTLRVEFDGEVRWYFGAWIGFAATPESGGVGVGGGAEVGARWFVAGDVALGLGAGLTTRWVFSGADGDFGHYDFMEGALIPGLRLRVDVGM